MSAVPQQQCQTAIRCREQSRQERNRLERSKASDEDRRARDRAYKEAKAIAKPYRGEPKTHCEFGGHPWIPENLIVTERVTMSGRVYYTARCRLCGRMPKSRMVKRTAIESSRSEMMARAATIRHRLLGTCTDLMTSHELAEWREERARLTAEHDRLLRASGGQHE